MPEERKLVTILFADVTGSTALGLFWRAWKIAKPCAAWQRLRLP